jgi:hypothetical protein
VDNTDKIRIAIRQIRGSKLPVDESLLVFYDFRNTGKEVILKYMSSYHSEVAAA